MRESHGRGCAPRDGARGGTRGAPRGRGAGLDGTTLARETRQACLAEEKEAREARCAKIREEQ